MNLCELFKTQQEIRAEEELDPSPASSQNNKQQKSSLLGACYRNSPCSRGKSVQVGWYRCVSSHHTATNTRPHSPFSHKHNQSPVVALQVMTCPAPEVHTLKSLLHFKWTLFFLKWKEDKCLRPLLKGNGFLHISVDPFSRRSHFLVREESIILTSHKHTPRLLCPTTSNVQDGNSCQN